jgi:hypothetical protein
MDLYYDCSLCDVVQEQINSQLMSEHLYLTDKLVTKSVK